MDILESVLINKMQTIKNMKAGDVIPFDLPEMVTATVEDIPVFRAKYGISQGNHALKVLNMIRHDVVNQDIAVVQE